jgi:hypothetical protein
LFALELRRDQREVEVGHLGMGDRRTRQHHPKPVRWSRHADARKAPTQPACLPATDDLIVQLQPLR